MGNNQWRVFIDTNVLIAGLASRTGASAAILTLGEAGEIMLVMSQHILIEADRVFSLKFPHLTDQFRVFIKNLTPLLLDDPKPKDVRKASQIIEPGDAPIIAAVKCEQVDYLVTLDTKHFNTAAVKDYLATPVVTPAEFLNEFRKFWENQ